MNKVNIGSASLVVIFVTLCLTVFAALALSTAIAELKLAEKSALAVQEYYQVDLEGAILAEELHKLWQQDRDIEAISQVVATNGGNVAAEGEALLISYSLLINQQQMLNVILKLDDSLHILKWQAENTGEWLPEDDLRVWLGSEL